jgi:hypothetical protein
MQQQQRYTLSSDDYLIPFGFIFAAAASARICRSAGINVSLHQLLRRKHELNWNKCFFKNIVSESILAAGDSCAFWSASGMQQTRPNSPNSSCHPDLFFAVTAATIEPASSGGTHQNCLMLLRGNCLTSWAVKSCSYFPLCWVGAR